MCNFDHETKKFLQQVSLSQFGVPEDPVVSVGCRVFGQQVVLVALSLADYAPGFTLPYHEEDVNSFEIKIKAVFNC